MQQLLIKNIEVPEWSFKNIDSEHHKALRKSINKHGQTKNIIVRSIGKDKYEIIDGKEVFKIIRDLGNVDYIWCYVYRDITDLEALLLYLEHDFYFENNFVTIAYAVKEINKAITKLDISKYTRYSFNEVNELLLLTQYDFTKFEEAAVEKNSKLF